MQFEELMKVKTCIQFLIWEWKNCCFFITNSRNR